MNTIGWLESVWQDFRYGARVLRRSPGFAAVALLSLALGIGANAAIFQLLDVVRLRTLPLHHPEQIVEVRITPNDYGRTGSFNGARPMLTNPLWEKIRDGQQSLTELFAWGTASFDMSSGGESRPVEGMFVSGGFFNALEGRAARGRLIEPADDVRGCGTPGAVISFAFWQQGIRRGRRRRRQDDSSRQRGPADPRRREPGVLRRRNRPPHRCVRADLRPAAPEARALWHRPARRVVAGGLRPLEAWCHRRAGLGGAHRALAGDLRGDDAAEVRAGRCEGLRDVSAQRVSVRDGRVGSAQRGTARRSRCCCRSPGSCCSSRARISPT